MLIPVQGHLLPPFQDGNTTTASAAAAIAAGKGAGKQQQQQQQQQQQGVCGWEEAPSSRKQQQAGQPGGVLPTNATAPSNSSSGGNATASDNVAKVVKATLEQQIEQQVEAKCRHLCSQSEAAAAALSQATATLRAAMPLLPLPAGAPALLRARRCTACKEVTRTLRRAQLGKSFLAAMSGKSRVQAAADAVRLSNRPAFSASGQPVNRQFLCVIEVRACWGLGAFSWVLAGQAADLQLLWVVFWGKRAVPPFLLVGWLVDCLDAAPAFVTLTLTSSPPACAPATGGAQRRPGVRHLQGAPTPPDQPAPAEGPAPQLHDHTGACCAVLFGCFSAFGRSCRACKLVGMQACECVLARPNCLSKPAALPAAADRYPTQAAWAGRRCHLSRW